MEKNTQNKNEIKKKSEAVLSFSPTGIASFLYLVTRGRLLFLFLFLFFFFFFFFFTAFLPYRAILLPLDFFFFFCVLLFLLSWPIVHCHSGAWSQNLVTVKSHTNHGPSESIAGQSGELTFARLSYIYSIPLIRRYMDGHSLGFASRDKGERERRPAESKAGKEKRRSQIHLLFSFPWIFPNKKNK
jgi:signal transduction histidine kinase